MPAAGPAPAPPRVLGQRALPGGWPVRAGGQRDMPGMNSGVNVNDPTVIAAFKSALVHQGLIALLIFALLGLVWIAVRARQPAAAQADGQAGTAGPAAATVAEPIWRQVLRVGFGLLWVFDGILQAQPKMAIGLPSQVIQPAAASSPHWV